MNNLNCSPAVETRLWKVRNLLYRAVQETMLDHEGDVRATVKQAYEDLSVLLDELSSNLRRQ